MCTCGSSDLSWPQNTLCPMHGKKLALRGRLRAAGQGRNHYRVVFGCIITALSLSAISVAVIRNWQDTTPLDPRLWAPPWDHDPAEIRGASMGGTSLLGAERGGVSSHHLLGRSGLEVAEPGELWHASEAVDGLGHANSKGGSGVRRKQYLEVMRKQQKIRLAAESGEEGGSGRGVGGLEKAPYRVTMEDMVAAIPSHLATEAQLKAGRSARLGMRSVVVTNYTETSQHPYPQAPNEVWTSYPDANPVRSFYPGDQRAALAPFIAVRELGDTFKWLLYGDDDTVFFTDAALELASTMDSNLPYLVTDNLWFSTLFGGAWHPHPQAPRCLPCGYTRNVTGALGIHMVAGCPCTPALICGKEDGYNGTFKHGCGVPRSPSRTYSMHGGAGSLISIGLLRAVDWGAMERCVNQQWSSGGDSFLTICLWELGFAHTTPDPLWHPAGLQMFDPSPKGLNPDDFIVWKASHVLGNMLQEAAGVCRGLCRLEVDHTVSLHLRARRTGESEEGAALFVRAFSRMHSRLSGRLRPGVVSRLEDCSNATSRTLAVAIDASLEAGVEVVRQFSRRQEMANKSLQSTIGEALLLRTNFGSLRVQDSAQAGMANAVANHILGSILEIALRFSKEGNVDGICSKAAGLPGKSVEDWVEEMEKIRLESLAN